MADPITAVNLVLCIIILALGCWGYVRRKDQVPLYIGIAFGIFGVSHAMKLLGLAGGLTTFLIIIRVIAYLLVVFALYKVVAKR